jgi:localization factor PodJL
MNFGFASSVKGIRSDARRTAEEAARRAGLPLNDWLDAIILQQAAKQGITPQSQTRFEDELPFEELSDLQLRLDDLERRLDQMTRNVFAAYAPKRSRDEADPLVEQFARLEQRIEQLASNITRASAAELPNKQALEFAIAEIAARRRMDKGDRTPAPDPTGLENLLRRITDQIETLRRPDMEGEIAALRSELAEIGHTINEALPRRAIESIEKQIQELAYSVVDSRQAGIDSNVLAGIEYGLAELRDALRELVPSEKLLGYNEAIEALGRKIDFIVAQDDPAMIAQLDHLFATLRDMAAHVASDETVGALTARIQALSDKIDHLATGGSAGDAFNRLELRIDALSRAVSERANGGDTAIGHVEALLQSLSAKIEQLQSRGDWTALDHFEGRITKFVERLEATDSRLNHLDAIERGLADLLVHIEEIRTQKEAPSARADTTPGVDLLKQDIAHTHNALAAVSGTLDRVADRLTTIENDIRSNRIAPAAGERAVIDLTQVVDAAPTPVAKSAVRHDLITQTTTTVSREGAPEAPSTVSADTISRIARQIEVTARPDLHEDQPLEPGSGRPGSNAAAGLRTVSEAALGAARSNVPATGSKSSFIAAARRAAQAAGQDPKNGQARPDSSRKTAGVPLRTKVATRAKVALLAASIIAIVVGLVQITSHIFNFGIFETTDSKVAVNFETDPAAGSSEIQSGDNETVTASEQESKPTPGVGDVTAGLLTPQTLPSLTPAPQAPKGDPVQSLLNSVDAGSLSALLSPPLLNAPSTGPAPAAKGDVTGTIARTPADSRTARPAAPVAQPPAADNLPAAIGGARLRNAAAAGDPAAAYEVAMRFMEGRGVPANLEEAAKWLERAAGKGLAPAQFRYASMLEKGQGVRKDLAAAQKLYVTVAGKGHAKAMHNLAVLYAEGVDGRPDYANAVLWFRKAAEHGVADSQFNLAVLVARGLGTEKNIAESYKWFALAAAQGDRDAGRKRDDAAATLDAPTLAAAQEAAKKFVTQAQPTAATAVPEPWGGWDRAAPPPQDKPRAAGPLSISAAGAGKQ